MDNIEVASLSSEQQEENSIRLDAIESFDDIYKTFIPPTFEIGQRNSSTTTLKEGYRHDSEDIISDLSYSIVRESEDAEEEITKGESSISEHAPEEHTEEAPKNLDNNLYANRMPSGDIGKESNQKCDQRDIGATECQSYCNQMESKNFGSSATQTGGKQEIGATEYYAQQMGLPMGMGMGMNMETAMRMGTGMGTGMASGMTIGMGTGMGMSDSSFNSYTGYSQVQQGSLGSYQNPMAEDEYLKFVESQSQGFPGPDFNWLQYPSQPMQHHQYRPDAGSFSNNGIQSPTHHSKAESEGSLQMKLSCASITYIKDDFKSESSAHSRELNATEERATDSNSLNQEQAAVEPSDSMPSQSKINANTFCTCQGCSCPINFTAREGKAAGQNGHSSCCPMPGKANGQQGNMEGNTCAYSPNMPNLCCPQFATDSLNGASNMEATGCVGTPNMSNMPNMTNMYCPQFASDSLNGAGNMAATGCVCSPNMPAADCRPMPCYQMPCPAMPSCYPQMAQQCSRNCLDIESFVEKLRAKQQQQQQCFPSCLTAPSPPCPGLIMAMSQGAGMYSSPAFGPSCFGQGQQSGNDTLQDQTVYSADYKPVFGPGNNFNHFPKCDSYGGCGSSTGCASCSNCMVCPPAMSFCAPPASCLMPCAPSHMMPPCACCAPAQPMPCNYTYPAPCPVCSPEPCPGTCPGPCAVPCPSQYPSNVSCPAPCEMSHSTDNVVSQATSCNLSQYSTRI